MLNEPCVREASCMLGRGCESLHPGASRRKLESSICHLSSKWITFTNPEERYVSQETGMGFTFHIPRFSYPLISLPLRPLGYISVKAAGPLLLHVGNVPDLMITSVFIAHSVVLEPLRIFSKKLKKKSNKIK